MIPAARAFYLLALTTLLGIVGVLVPGLTIAALVLDGLLILAVLRDARVARGVELAAARRWPRILAQGSASELQIEIESAAERPLGLRLRETLHPSLAAHAERRSLELPASGAARWTIDLEPRRRGEVVAGPLVARVLGPWRLAWGQRRLLEAEAVRVVPRVRWTGDVGRLLLVAQRTSLGRQMQRVRGVGTEPYALREYLPGDPPNRIHWKATARHGRLVTREETWERGARLIVLLDCARAMSALDAGQSKLDHALAATLALARAAVARGDRVTVVAFSDRVERRVRMTSERDVRSAYAALYDLESRLVEPAFDLAAATALALDTRRSTVVLLTSVVDLVAAELLRSAVQRLERRHRPILVRLEDPELRALAMQPPEDTVGAFAQAAALDIQLANRRLTARLRHRGIRVVSTSADRLAAETLAAYLSLFGAEAALGRSSGALQRRAG
ncbi:MAG: DUF58 domain-containing protein [Acidobacteriota bacterium]